MVDCSVDDVGEFGEMIGAESPGLSGIKCVPLVVL